MPVVSNPNYAVAGALIGFGVINSDMHRRAAEYVDRIFRGVSPAALSVEQPIRFDLIVILKSTKALEIRIPMSVML